MICLINGVIIYCPIIIHKNHMCQYPVIKYILQECKSRPNTNHSKSTYTAVQKMKEENIRRIFFFHSFPIVTCLSGFKKSAPEIITKEGTAHLTHPSQMIKTGLYPPPDKFRCHMQDDNCIRCSYSD